MKFTSALVALAIVRTNAQTPTEKVIGLMDGMLAKGKKEMQDEQKQFAAYKQFCTDTARTKKIAIKEAGETIQNLQADIEKHTADASRLGKEVAEHDADISTWNGDHKAATTVRGIEKADFDKMHKDYSESVDALERATTVMKKQAYDRKQAAAESESLVQVSALLNLKLISSKAKVAIEAYLAQDPMSTAPVPIIDTEAKERSAEALPYNPTGTGLEVQNKEAIGYEFRSSGVVDMLSKLHDKFIGERTDLEKKETSSKQAFEMLSQDLTAQVSQGTKDREAKSTFKSKKLQAKADAEGDLTDTSTTKAADEKYLSDLTSTCEMKASDFESRQQLRAEEMVAINKAIEIISSNAVAGNAEKHLPSMLEQLEALGKGSTALAQVRTNTAKDAQARAAAYLRTQASRLNSRVLSAIAVRANGDAFAKVKKMIKDLIVRLMEEATEEVEHKGWCDTELSTNEQTRNEKTAGVEMLHAEIDQLEASLTKLSEDIAELTEGIAKLAEAMALGTKLRAEEKATNTETIKDAQEAQMAVGQALTVLKVFYAKAGEATALLQQQPEAPAIFDSPYKGLQSENGGVVGMLEVIDSDFARLEAETTAAEATAQKEYETFMTDSKVDKAAKSSDLEHKTAKKQDQEQALTTKKADVEATQKELDAALAYYDKLKPSCIDAGGSFEDRTKRRKEEIESLQQALRILNGEEN